MKIKSFLFLLEKDKNHDIASFTNIWVNNSKDTGCVRLWKQKRVEITQK